MHDRFERADELSREVIGAAIEVHRLMGPGLLESIYEWCLAKELELRGIPHGNQKPVTVQYKNFARDENLRFDILADECLLIEVKARDKVHPLNKAQLLSYMKLLDVPIGLLINFNVPKLTDGVSRMILPGSNSR